MGRSIDVRDLGVTDYEDVHELQRRLRESRIAGDAPDTLLLTEHRPVVTLGRAHPEADLRVPASMLGELGIGIVQTERGGDITYHGPGQMVAYGIIGLQDWGLPLVDYVTGLEAAVIEVLSRYGIEGAHHRDARGVWVEGRKIASVGIHVRRWVTMHGIALNVTDMADEFGLINPCGMAGVEMTSIAAEGHRPGVSVRGEPGMDDVKAAFVEAFARVFGCSVTREAATGTAGR